LERERLESMIDDVRKLRRGEEIRLAKGVGTILFSATEIRDRVFELGREVARDYEGEVPVLVAVLRGGFIFQCDLGRAAAIAQEFDFLQVSRFNPREKGRTAVKVLHDLRSDIRGRHVLVIEGIRTASAKVEYVQRFLQLREPASLRFAALVRHGGAVEHPVPLHYKGFDIGEEFVIGYGLDYGEHYRNLPVIAGFTPAASGEPGRVS
jgi:hypoxanthine phosphoribosyltransferase